MKLIDLEETKKIQIGILDEVDEFCSNNNIPYYMIAGTLLGAVRHKGYIPWDDDIDICMKRKDYNKFIQTYKGKSTYLLSSEVNSNCYYPFVKVCKNRTRVDEEYLYAANLGINIDIFPIDNIPDSKSERLKYFRYLNKHRKLLERKISIRNRGIIEKIILYVYSLLTFYESPRVAVKKINKTAGKYNSENTKMCGSTAGWGIGEAECVKTEDFASSVLLEFEGRKYPAPCGYHNWLSNRYGDYMKLPPKEEQVAKHNRKDYIL